MNKTLAQVGGGLLAGAALVIGALAFPHQSTVSAAPPPVMPTIPVREVIGSSMTWATLKIGGTVVGGDSTRKGRENMIEVLAFNQSVLSPRDAGSGLPTGRRQYQPLLIRKRIDKASPLLMKALTENNAVELKVDIYRTTPTGEEQPFYEITLKDARVTEVKVVQDGSASPMEEVSFTFRSITWTHLPSNTSYQDDQAQ